MSVDLRCGDWREVLADVGEVDAVICDPPYSSKTHDGHDGTVGRKGKRRRLEYEMWDKDTVRLFIEHWAERTKGWIVCFTSHDLVPSYMDAMEGSGRYVFAPLPWVAYGSRVRLSGDGPSSWTCWIVVSRPKNNKFMRWGTLPGAYLHGAENHATVAQGYQQHRVVGGKPDSLMRAIIGDYTRPGDLVCDPCAGGATTLLAAYQTGRRAIGAELDPATYAKAKARLDRAMAQPHLFDPGLAKAVQNKMF